jgi:hypothetical protein
MVHDCKRKGKLVGKLGSIPLIYCFKHTNKIKIFQKLKKRYCTPKEFTKEEK